MIYLKEFANHNEYTAYTADTRHFLTPNTSLCQLEDDCHFTPMGPAYDYSKDYFTFYALEDGTFKFSGNSINYSLDSGQTWVSLASNTNTPTVNAGNRIMWKASGLTPLSYKGIGRFSSTAKFDAEGNIMSIVSGDNFVNAVTVSNLQFFYLFGACRNLISAENLLLPATTLAQNCYYGMFRNCEGMKNAPKSLPATTLADGCYYEMFAGCTSLRTAPELPATILYYRCYYSMFSGCTLLAAAPELPATTLAGAGSCYYNMFAGCTSLRTAPELPATTLEISCYERMFYNCTSLITAPELPATTLANNCYADMFYGCSSLTTAPSTLPATTLAEFCYNDMFNGCTSLATAPELPVTTLATGCYSSMFSGCTSLTTPPPTLPATALAERCYASMFRGCTSLTTAPELPATTLVNYCYAGMFYGCSRLNYIKALFTTEPSTTYTNNWVSGVAASGTFVKNSAAQWDVTGVDGVPNGWTIETASS